MKRRQTTLADGRYLIFYSFDDETPQDAPQLAEELNVGLAQAKPEEEEERDV